MPAAPAPMAGKAIERQPSAGRRRIARWLAWRTMAAGGISIRPMPRVTACRMYLAGRSPADDTSTSPTWAGTSLLASAATRAPPAQSSALETPPPIDSMSSSELTSTSAMDLVMSPKRSVMLERPTLYVLDRMASPPGRGRRNHPLARRLEYTDRLVSTRGRGAGLTPVCHESPPGTLSTANYGASDW